jgi:putative nucleotidyltransferase with HDIG domain
MKPGNKQTTSITPTQINHVTSIEQANGKSHISILITILPVLSAIFAILPGILQKDPGIDIVKTGVLTMILTSAATFYIRLNSEILMNKTFPKIIISICYLSSICLLLLVPEPETFCFWMIGGLLVSMLIDNKLGLLLHFNLSFILGIALSLRPEIVIQLLIIGVLMSLLAGALRQRSTVIYAIIIILSTNITLSFAINNFIFDTNGTYNYLNSMFSILAILAISFFLCSFYDTIDKKDMTLDSAEHSLDNADRRADAFASRNSEVLNEGKDASLDRITVNREEQRSISATSLKKDNATEHLEGYDPNRNLGISASFELLCDKNNELMSKMKEFSESLYSHAIHIGDLSSRAAKEIGANDLIAMAGGLYHEVGKLNGKNYIEEGLLIAEDYAFPKELKAILKEHNIKYEKPSSVEAAIVMLSDNVVSTIEYIAKTEDHKFTTNKIIDNIFQMRMDKGTFDTSNLSLKDFKKLREFYQKEFAK